MNFPSLKMSSARGSFAALIGKATPRLINQTQTKHVIRLCLLLILLISLIFSPSPSMTRAQAQSGWQWYKVDTHVHSSVSADAFVDVGIHSQLAIANGYNAIFLTDHNGGSSFQINNLTANHMAFEDAYTRWDLGTYGTQTVTTNQLVTTPVHTGTQSLHLRSTSNGSGETYIWTKRGPNFRSGNIILDAWVYPTRIDPGSGLYVSASIGGDPTVEAVPDGYTTRTGVVSPGKSTVLVWQLGSARTPSSNPNARVLTYPLNYTLNSWNHYTINVSSALADIPAADLPLDYNGLVQLKMTAASNGGTAEGYFDTYSINASNPVAPADEYVYRTGIVDDFNTSSFKVFPSYEMGQQRHTNRFNFGITAASQYRSYTYGSDGITETQQSGYPAQLNHPGTTITVQEAINGQGLGADFLEVRDQPWIDAWDAILQQGALLLGNWSSDTHSGLSAGRAATYIYAPALDFDKLVQSLFEGRTYNATNNFSGRILFNLNSSSQEPYPARYPVYVSDAQATANVHMAVTSGLSTGWTMRWYRNGGLLATDNRTAASYDATKSISLAGASTYVRAEVRASSTSLRGMTQPIFFVDVPGLPLDKSFRIDKVTTASGNGYNRLLTKGITTASWSSANSALSIMLEDPANALVNLLINSNSAPNQIMVNGVAVPASSTLASFDAATNTAWIYNAPTSLLYLKVKHSGSVANAVVGFGGALPTPTITPTPTNTATSTPASLLFTDDFETGNLSRWTSVTGLTVQQQQVDSGLYAARQTSTGTATWAYKQLTAAQPTVYYRTRFKIISMASNVYLLKFRTATGTSLVGLYVSSTGRLAYRNDTTAAAVTSTTNVTSGVWHDLQARASINGANSQVEVWLDGIRLADLSKTESLGTAPIGRLQLGDNSTGRTYDVALENVIASTAFIGSSPSTATNTAGPTFTPTATATNSVPSTSTPTATATSLIPPTSTPTATATNSVPPTSTPTMTPTSPGSSSSFTFLPIADSYVNETSPASNYGSTSTLRTDASPVVRSYLRFDVQGLSGTVTKATLRVWANSGNSVGCTASTVDDNTWTESTINFTNAPPVGTALGSSGSFAAGAWISMDVTPYITGNGTFNLALISPSSTAVSLGSRESGTPPQLIVETQ